MEYRFRDGIFCSYRCIRAFCLESLEILDALDTPDSRIMATDLHDIHRWVAEILATVLGE
ncbi:MAG: hypothetical protein ABSB97_08770 [Thermoplasmata archaeon]